jgi:hypothetical protein
VNAGCVADRMRTGTYSGEQRVGNPAAPSANSLVCLPTCCSGRMTDFRLCGSPAVSTAIGRLNRGGAARPESPPRKAHVFVLQVPFDAGDGGCRCR